MLSRPLAALALVFVCLDVAAVARPRAGAPRPDVVAFVNVNVVPMDAERVLPAHTVLVRGGRVWKVGPTAEVRVPRGAAVVDGGGTRYLMPGLADMHTHADQTEDMLLYVANGVTTILNMGSASGAFVDRVRHDVDAGRRIGPHAFVGFWVDGSPETNGFVAKTPAEGVAAVDYAKAHGYEFLKVYSFLSRDTFEAMAKEARRIGLPVVGHGVHAVGLEDAFAAGQVMVAHGEEYIYTYFDNKIDRARIPAAAEMTRAAHVFVTPNLSAYAAISAQWGKPEQVRAFLAATETRYMRPENRAQWASSDYVRREGNLDGRLEFLEELTRAFRDAGVPLLVGTDSPSIPGVPAGYSIHDELRLLVASGLTPYEALAAATRVPGEFIARTVPSADPFGTVAVGKRADLLLLDRDPLADVAAVRDPAGVMVRGRWLARSDLAAALDAQALGFERDAEAEAAFRARAAKEGVPAAVAAYRTRLAAGAERPLREGTLNVMGYELLGANKTSEAVAVFALAVELYPRSGNTYDSLGEAYMKAGNARLAVENYRRSLALDPQNRNAVAMLKKLGARAT
jgi:imidazolonepropionase-like amidohydrolase